MRRRVTRAAETAATEAVEELVQQAPAQAAAPSPVNGKAAQMPARMAAVVERVLRYDGDPVEDYERLMRELALEQAVTSTVVAAALNRVQQNAALAHLLYVTTKVDHARFEIDNDVVLGAMRDAATAALQAEKDAKTRNKAITDADVRDRAATMFPDEWRSASERQVEAEMSLEQLRRLADLWRERSYALGQMKG